MTPGEFVDIIRPADCPIFKADEIEDKKTIMADLRSVLRGELIEYEFHVHTFPSKKEAIHNVNEYLKSQQQ
jgi:hypothetical protein